MMKSCAPRRLTLIGLVVVVLLAGCLSPQDANQDDQSRAGGTRVAEYNGPSPWDIVIKSSDCWALEANVLVPLDRAAALVPNGYPILEVSGQAIVTVMTLQCPYLDVGIIYGDEVLWNGQDPVARISSVSVSLVPQVGLEPTRVYVLWGGMNGTAMSAAFTQKEVPLTAEPLFVTSAQLTPYDSTFSAAISANSTMGTLVATYADIPMIPAQPQGIAWYMEDENMQYKLTFGLVSLLRSSEQSVGYITAPPESGLAQLLGATATPAAVTLSHSNVYVTISALPV